MPKAAPPKSCTLSTSCPSRQSSFTSGHGTFSSARNLATVYRFLVSVDLLVDLIAV